MTIRKGEEWGVAGPRPADLTEVGDDAALRRVVEEARRAGVPVPPCVVRSGSLASTVGSARLARPLDAPDWRLLPIDVVRVELDEREHWFVSHLVARRGWWRGPIVAAMNGEFLGSWDVAPRSHPNDGRVDVLEVEASMPVGQRWQARRRLPTGAHLPHPAVTERRVRQWERTFTTPVGVWLDGESVGRYRRLVLTVEPDAATLCV